MRDGTITGRPMMDINRSLLNGDYEVDAKASAVEIDMDSFTDGYNAGHINCIDLPIAAAASVFKKTNYASYCALYSLFVNWVNEDDWLNVRRGMLSVLNIKIYEISPRSLTITLRSELSAGRPVIMIVKYGALFYSRYYKWGDFDHAIVVSGHNPINGTITIRDREIVRDLIDAGHIKGDALHRLAVTDDMVAHIWRLSNDVFERERSEHAGKLYSLEAKGPAPAARALLTLLATSVRPENSRFRSYILGNGHADAASTSINTMETIRRRYHRSLITLFDFAQHCDVTTQRSPNARDRFAKFGVDFLKFRGDALSRIQLLELKGRRVSGSLANSLAAKSDDWDSRLASELSALCAPEGSPLC